MDQAGRLLPQPADFSPQLINVQTPDPFNIIIMLKNE